MIRPCMPGPWSLPICPPSMALAASPCLRLGRTLWWFRPLRLPRFPSRSRRARSLNPAMLPPAGGTATATLGVQSPSFTPSGTIIQANVLETFSLASGDKVSEETRSEDILLYNALAPANSTMGAKFPVTPSHQYTLTQLVTGKVHLDILAGREGVRGQPGGNDPLTLSDGTSTLSVP